MKKIKTLLLVLASTVGLASCGDFLEIEPRTFVSEDNFWNEKTDIDQMVAGVYTSLQSPALIERCIMWGETRSDNVAGGLNYDKNQNVYRVLKENLLSTNAYTTWIDFYRVINKCNTIIEMAPVVSQRDPVFTPSDVKATQAEMKTLRALMYFYLVRAFKDVPYYTNAIIDEDGAGPQAAADGDSIVRVSIADLEGCVHDALKAYPRDANSKFKSDCNRITQNAIYALLADLCLWDNQYQKAADYAQRVIEAKQKEYEEDYSRMTSFSGGNPARFQYTSTNYVGETYPLYPCYASSDTYGAAFSSIFGDENSFESLFELNFSYDGSDGNYLANSGMASLYGSYSASDQKGQGVLGVPEKIETDIVQGSFRIYDHKNDCRFYTDINSDDEYTKGYIAKGVARGSTVSTATSPLPWRGKPNTNEFNSNRNWIFYRLTDVMLLQAEALVEMAGENLMTETTDADGKSATVYDENLQKAFSIVWAVNRRSIMKNSVTAVSTDELSIANYTSREAMRELVMKERRRELMFEGKRWFDILRRCHREQSPLYAHNNVDPKITTGSSKALFVNYESLFWPYNKNEVKINTLLSQKPFYGSDTDEDGFSKTK